MLARGRLTLLAESSEVLGESLDYHSALGSLARLLVPWVADWCLIEVIGEPAAGLAAHSDPSMARLVETLGGASDGDRGPRVGPRGPIGHAGARLRGAG